MLTVTDWIAGGAGLFSVGTTAFGVIYNRGRIDAHGRFVEAAIKDLKAALETIQDGRLVDAREGGALESRVTAHERGCEERQRGIEKRFDRIDAGLENLGAQIRNVVLELADRLRSVPAGPTPRRSYRP